MNGLIVLTINHFVTSVLSKSDYYSDRGKNMIMKIHGAIIHWNGRFRCMKGGPHLDAIRGATTA